MKKLLLLAILTFFGISTAFAQGLNCANPIVINSLPYTTTDNTANYSDNPLIEGIPGNSGCGSTNSYLSGNDVVYSYTAVINGVINVIMSPTEPFSGIFAYSSCANIGVNCLAGVANSNTGIRSFDLPVVAGSTYYIVISTWASPQTTAYTLTIQAQTCPIPTNLSVNNITLTSAQLSWANPSGTTSWEIAVQSAGTSIPSGSGTTTSTNTNYLVSGLSPETSYQYYVRANCGNGTFSAWTGPFVFSTTCNAFSVPFQEGFNSGSLTESCWTILNVNNDGDSWNTNYTSSPFEGNQSAVLTTDLNAGNNNDWLISPQIILTGNQLLKFQYKVQSSLEPNEFRVMLSTSGTSLDDFNITLTPLTSYTNTNYVQAIVNLAGITGPIYIAWHVPPGTLDGWRIYIDNVIVEDLPTCPEPSTPTVSNLTSTSASIGWSEIGTATQWEILTVPCGSPAPTDATVGQSVTTNPYVLSGLSPTTCYDVYVRAICNANDSSNWTLPITFTTTITPPICGGIFTDEGGPNGNYSNNTDSIVTICPSVIGDLVMVNFTSFSTETYWDGLYVYDGNSSTSPQIVSINSGGNVPGGLPGSFWGNSIPGPFFSTSPDGCLTFRFRSDGSVAQSGWTADIVCLPTPPCLKPTNVTANNITQTSITFGWTESESATAWEVLAVPAGSATPTPTTSGQLVTTNPVTISGLSPGTTYNVYVRSQCPDGSFSFWSLPTTVSTLAINDECENAIVVPVNYNNCAQVTEGRVTGATASSVPLSAPCIGSPDDDVWFQFVSTNSSIVTSLQNVTGTSTSMGMSLYSGTCGNLTQINCNTIGGFSLLSTNLAVGETYFLRVYSTNNTPQSISFDLCVTTPSTCTESQSICGVNNYANTTGIPSLGTVGCLVNTPNPTFFTIKISDSGSVNMLLTQSTIGGGLANLDVDYAAWGPFPDQATACAAINGGQVPGIGGNTTTTLTGCSFSASPTEHFNIANAIAGEYYILLVTNFSNQAGYINVTVENTSTGSIDCTGIRMVAFIDNNSNGTKEANEPYFPLGQFHYEINNNGTVHNVTSPSGAFSIYDQNPSNSYDLDYSISPNYASTYSSSGSYTNVTVASGGMTTYYFPVTILQNQNDLGVVIVPLDAPRAGTTYKNKIVYTNNGTQTIASGTLTYNASSVTTITNISQLGTTPITNGFTYNFANLLPFESRSIIVTMSVPAIPTVSIGQLLTNTASVVPPSGDIVASNDSSVSTQAVIAAYDPNDKMESHGDKILFSSFTSNDYLEYTIRFENTGNAGAINVSVSDVLDSQLDETTLIMTNASHNYTLDRVDNTLVWNFENILLPVSIPGTDIGKGYINFKIKPRTGYAVGDIIPNTASIYFDTNPPIVTNTFNTEFVAALGNPLFSNNSVLLYPNPANHEVNISIQNSSENLETIVIYDMLGKNIKTISDISANEIRIDVANFAKGVYLVEITSDNNLKLIKKLIIQ